MKTKSFQQYLEKRLDNDEIEQQAQLEIKILQSIQKLIPNAKDKECL